MTAITIDKKLVLKILSVLEDPDFAYYSESKILKLAEQLRQAINQQPPDIR